MKLIRHTIFIMSCVWQVVLCTYTIQSLLALGKKIVSIVDINSGRLKMNVLNQSQYMQIEWSLHGAITIFCSLMKYKEKHEKERRERKESSIYDNFIAGVCLFFIEWCSINTCFFLSSQADLQHFMFSFSNSKLT